MRCQVFHPDAPYKIIKGGLKKQLPFILKTVLCVGEAKYLHQTLATGLLKWNTHLLSPPRVLSSFLRGHTDRIL